MLRSDSRFPGDVFGPNTRAIIFDMDGVIIDSERLHMLADAETFLRHGMEVPEEAWVDIFGMKSESGLAMILERYGDGSQDPSVLAREKRELYLGLSAEGLNLIDGVREYLDACRGRFEKLAVTTSGKADVQMPLLERFGIREYFDVIVTGDGMRYGKPDPEPYLVTVSWLGFPADACVVIEDAIAGIRSAKAAGCVTVGLSTTLPAERLRDAGADLIVGSFAELMPS
ncbi:MAG: HAD family phosphatase [Candidatus Moranbacteria bacterium]|nr:HAD family phosphatase [Candidatus Moranbacteria bacterium]